MLSHLSLKYWIDQPYVSTRSINLCQGIMQERKASNHHEFLFNEAKVLKLLDKICKDEAKRGAQCSQRDARMHIYASV